jgi:L-fucose isomerase-like protein
MVEVLFLNVLRSDKDIARNDRTVASHGLLHCIICYHFSMNFAKQTEDVLYTPTKTAKRTPTNYPAQTVSMNPSLSATDCGPHHG